MRRMRSPCCARAASGYAAAAPPRFMAANTSQMGLAAKSQSAPLSLLCLPRRKSIQYRSRIATRQYRASAAVLVESYRAARNRRRADRAIRDFGASASFLQRRRSTRRLKSIPSDQQEIDRAVQGSPNRWFFFLVWRPFLATPNAAFHRLPSLCALSPQHC